MSRGGDRLRSACYPAVPGVRSGVRVGAERGPRPTGGAQASQPVPSPSGEGAYTPVPLGDGALLDPERAGEPGVRIEEDDHHVACLLGFALRRGAWLEGRDAAG